MTITEWQREIHAYAVEKGWWPGEDEPERNTGEMFMLMVTEIAEAMEAWREGQYHQYWRNPATGEVVHDLSSGPALMLERGFKPEGVAVELADCIIRILDWAEAVGVDMGELIRLKHEYNLTRPYRHGGKKA